MTCAGWEPKIGDVVEYVGRPQGGHTERYVGGVAVVVNILDAVDWVPQLELDWIVIPKGHDGKPSRGGVWAGNCKKLTEIENG